jgi:hypothetical protein
MMPFFFFRLLSARWAIKYSLSLLVSEGIAKIPADRMRRFKASIGRKRQPVMELKCNPQDNFS